MSRADLAGTPATIPEGLSIRPMTREEVNFAIELAAAEGWNPGLDDADCFHAADPNAFFLATLDDQPAGCCSAVTYGDQFAFFGLFIVKPEFRGRGIGTQLTQTAMDYFGDRKVGLDGVAEMQDKYVRLGFQFAYRNVRYQGTARGESCQRTVELDSVPFEELAAYDLDHFLAPRASFLKRWINPAGGAALGFLKDRRLVGYGVIRPCRSGFKIGPLFADADGIAEDLFQALAARASGAQVFLDVPEPNSRAVALAKRHGMEPVFETARMYRHDAADRPLEHIFGVTTFELG